MAADKALAGSEQAIVELDTPQGKVPLKVLHLGASKVAGRLVLLSYAKESRPTIVAILAELEETQADPLSVDVVRASDKEASLRLTFLSRFRTAIAISGDEPQPCGK